MNSLKGQLLIATPQLIAPVFTRSVILMLEHSDEGAMGVILNHLTEATVSDISEKIFDEPFEWDKLLNLGGPVPGPLMVLHTRADLSDQEVLDGVYNAFEASKIQELLREKVEPSLVVVNYSGWGPGQLETEFDVDSWLTLPATDEHVFWDRDQDLWEVVVKAANARKLSEFLGLKEIPPDPTVN